MSSLADWLLTPVPLWALWTTFIAVWLLHLSASHYANDLVTELRGQVQCGFNDLYDIVDGHSLQYHRLRRDAVELDPEDLPEDYQVLEA
jgi:hypothetical protein